MKFNAPASSIKKVPEGNSRKMPKFYQRLGFLRTIVLFCCLAQAIQLTIAGCSHTAPYHHPNMPSSGQQDEVEAALRYRVLLLGDGGQPKRDEPVLQTLHEWARKHPGKTSIVFLGDNMYPEGMTAQKQHEAEAKLGPQLEVVKATRTHGLFIPGNHDWAKGKKNGLRAILAQEEFINDSLADLDREIEATEEVFLPKGGSPGPVPLNLPPSAPVVRLIVLNTQWWLHRYEKPKKDPETVIEDLKALLVTELPVIVVGHHPLETYGLHGGFRDWRKKPLMSLFRFVKWHLFKSDQDLNGSRNRNMVKQLKRAFEEGRAGTAETRPLQNRPPLLIYASGHDHSLQVLKGEIVDYLLVSGSASSEKVTGVTKGDNTLFAHAYSGFMAVDFLADGKVLLRVVEPEGKGVQFQHRLK